MKRRREYQRRKANLRVKGKKKQKDNVSMLESVLRVFKVHESDCSGEL